MLASNTKLTVLTAIKLTNDFRINGDFCTWFPDTVARHSLKIACLIQSVALSNAASSIKINEQNKIRSFGEYVELYEYIAMRVEIDG